MLLKKQRKIILIYGKTGSGKSTLAKKILKKYDRVIICDARAEYDGVIVDCFEDFLNYVLNKEKFTVCCRFDEDLDYDYLFKSIYEVGNVLLLLEEAEIYISPYVKRSDFLKLVKYGRHRDINILGVARRTSELSLDFRSQVDVIYTFKQTETKDLKILSDLGFNIDKVQALNEFEFEMLEY